MAITSAFVATDLVKTITACRACGGALSDLFSFGDVHLNAFPLPSDPPVEKAPINLVFCRTCNHIQLRHTVDRDRLFRHYWYKTSTQPAMVASVRDAVEWAISKVTIESGDTCVSIGCNDGAEMDFFPKNTNRIGVDPSRNLASEACAHCDIFVNDYFPTSQMTLDHQAKVIVSLACLYDVEDLGAFVEGVKAWLHPEGVWVAQVSYLPKTLETRNIGDFCHEHTSFFSLEVLEKLVRAHGMHISNYDFNDVNGGSLRVAVRPGDGPSVEFWDEPSYREMSDFMAQVETNADTFRTMMLHIPAGGGKVLGYGASTKWNSTLSLWDVGPDLLPAIADRDSRKWGRTTVTGIPIISEEEARSQQPTVFVLAIPQFFNAVREREQAFLDRGGRFLLPFPNVHYLFTTDAHPPAIRAEALNASDGYTSGTQ